MSSAQAEQIQATDVGLAKAVSVSYAQPFAQNMYPATQVPYHGAPAASTAHPETPAPIIGALSPETPEGTWQSPYTPPQSGGNAQEPTISDVSYWGGHPDKSYFTFVLLSVLFGLLGVDHFYVRSFHTGLLKIIVNLCTFGMWYIWDLLQIIGDGEKVRTTGLTAPFDWICGIARGVFIPQGQVQQFTSDKSYLLYAFLAIFFGWFGLDKLYMGNISQALAKGISVFSFFFTFFGIVWVLWDAVHALFMTRSIVNFGITSPLPYSFVFDPISFNKFKVDKPMGGHSGGFQLDDFVPAIPVPVLSYKKDLQPLVAPYVATIAQILKPVSQQPTEPAQPAQPTQQPTQSGGSRSETGPPAGPGPAIAGVLTAVIVAGGLKAAYDFLSKR